MSFISFIGKFIPILPDEIILLIENLLSSNDLLKLGILNKDYHKDTWYIRFPKICKRFNNYFGDYYYPGQKKTRDYYNTYDNFPLGFTCYYCNLNSFICNKFVEASWKGKVDFLVCFNCIESEEVNKIGIELGYSLGSACIF